MRWTLRISALAALLLAVYTVWPLIDLYRLARAVETRNIAELSRLVDLTSLRASVTRQVLQTYLVRSGKDARLGSLGRAVVVGIGTSLAQPALAQLSSPERLVELLAEGWPAPASPAGERRVRLMRPDLRGFWRVYADSEYRFRNFQVSVPPSVAPKERFRLGLYFIQWRWKLYDIELPEHLRVRLADEMIRMEQKK